MMSFGEFAQQLERAAVRARNEIDIPTEALMEHVKIEARAMIGHEHAEWPPLSAATLADKAAKGFAVPAPLLRTGEMRDSIECEAELSPEGAIGVVGSPDKIALYQELGTSRGIPPRPFLSTSLVKAQPEAERVFGEFAQTMLIP